MEFSRQEYWSGLPFSSLGDILDTGIEPRSPALQADSLPSESPGQHAATNKGVHLTHEYFRLAKIVLRTGKEHDS